MKLDDRELNYRLGKIQNVLERNRFTKQTETYGYNDTLCYKATYNRYSPSSNRNTKLYLAIYNSGTLMLQGQFKEQFIQDLKAIISDEIRGCKQLDML
jgi:ribonuclease HIII